MKIVAGEGKSAKFWAVRRRGVQGRRRSGGGAVRVRAPAERVQVGSVHRGFLILQSQIIMIVNTKANNYNFK